MTSTTTLRGQAREAIESELRERLVNEHRMGYHTLHVRRDGTATWYEGHNSSDDLIDPRADEFGFAAIKSVCKVGTGSFRCNCDFCNAVYDATEETDALEMGREYKREEKFATREEAIDEAVSAGDGSEALESMLREFEAIEDGYFNDEQ